MEDEDSNIVAEESVSATEEEVAAYRRVVEVGSLVLSRLCSVDTSSGEWKSAPLSDGVLYCFSNNLTQYKVIVPLNTHNGVDSRRVLLYLLNRNNQ